MNISAQLKEIAKKEGYNQQQVAEILGFRKSYISQLFNELNVSYEKAQAVFSKLGYYLTLEGEVKSLDFKTCTAYPVSKANILKGLDNKGYYLHDRDSASNLSYILDTPFVIVAKELSKDLDVEFKVGAGHYLFYKSND